MPQTTLEFSGDFTPAQEKDYVHLPFQVPPHTTRLEVEYRYSHQIDSDPMLSGGNTVDLGVFDARGIDFLTAGFRGWTGSERLSFFITETDATPGYLAGPLQEGQWHVLLGLYKIAPEGCHYEVKVTLNVEPEHAASPAVRVSSNDLPASPVEVRRGGWLRGEMHCHTFHSDGDSSPAELVRRVRERGLDFLAVTDHNSTSCQRELETFSDPGLVLIRGIEVTTFKGHFNVWGIPDWIEFRVRRPQDMASAIRYAIERGALTACNHPKPFGPPWDYADVEGYDCIEVWNGPWYVMNQSSLDFWTTRLAQGKRIVATGGSDWHHFAELDEVPPRAPGTPTMWVHVDAPPTAASILQAIRRGHVALSDEPEGPLLDLQAGPDFATRAGDVLERDPNSALPIQVHCERGAGAVLTLHDQHGIVFSQNITRDDQTVVTELPSGQSLFIRAELRAPDDNLRALTNPIYLTGRNS